MNKKIKGLLLGSTLASAGVASRIYYESQHFQREYYEIHSKKLPEAFDGFRIVLVTDLHNYDYDNGNQQLLKAIGFFDPDAVMIAGDMILAEPGYDMDVALRFIKDLTKQWPVYFANGNHEKRVGVSVEKYGRMYEKWFEHTKYPNFHILNNACLPLKKMERQSIFMG